MLSTEAAAGSEPGRRQLVRSGSGLEGAVFDLEHEQRIRAKAVVVFGGQGEYAGNGHDADFATSGRSRGGFPAASSPATSRASAS